MIAYAQKLRYLANWLDQHPTVAREILGEYEYPIIHVYVYADVDEDDFEKFQEVVRTIGDFEKDGYAGQLTAKHTEWRNPEKQEERLFTVSVTTSGVCEKVPKLDSEGKHVMLPKREYITSDTELEPQYEWKCPDSWLR